MSKLLRNTLDMGDVCVKFCMHFSFLVYLKTLLYMGYIAKNGTTIVNDYLART
jgi:hypothetical protein